MLIGLLAAIVAAIGYGTSSVLQAYGAQRAAAAAEARGATNHRTATGGPTLTSTIAAALTIWFVIGTCLDVISFVAGVIAARQLPLFLSQTIINADLVVTALLGVLVLRIGLRRRDWMAISGLLIALVAVGAVAGGSGGNYAAPAGHWAVFLGSVLVLVCGQLVVRRLGSGGAVAAGLVSGLVFGALAIAVRIVNGLGPLQWHVLLSDPAAWTIVIAGAGGFYLHTVALQLGSVNGASAALVAGETIVPGIVGVLWLGDTFRPGLAWLGALGFILAIVAAIAVAAFGSASAAESNRQGRLVSTPPPPEPGTRRAPRAPLSES